MDGAPGRLGQVEREADPSAALRDDKQKELRDGNVDGLAGGIGELGGEGVEGEGAE